MAELYGRHPADTNDEKLFRQDGKLPRSVNPDSQRYNSNIVRRSVNVINNTIGTLLVLMDDGSRLVVPPSMNGTDQKCYFFVEYEVGSDVTFRTDPHLEADNVTRDTLLKIGELIEAARTDPATGVRYRNLSKIEYYYALDCSSLEEYHDGVYIDALNIHVYSSDHRTDAFKTHYGRSRYACRLNDPLGHNLPKGGPQAAGCSAVYYVNSGRNIQPVYVVNRFYTGILKPVYDVTKRPGIYIHSTQELYMLSNMRVPGRMFINEKDFDRAGVFKNINDVKAHYREAFKRVSSNADQLDAFLEFNLHMLPGVDWDIPKTEQRKKTGSNEKKSERKDKDPITTVKEMVILITGLIPIAKGIFDGCFSKNKDA